MLDPFGNQGLNKCFQQGWSEMKFKLFRVMSHKEKEKEKEKKKSKGVFSMKP